MPALLQVTDFFSYEHFYVLYCKFWELDSDHDFYISKEVGLFPLLPPTSFHRRREVELPHFFSGWLSCQRNSWLFLNHFVVEGWIGQPLLAKHPCTAVVVCPFQDLLKYNNYSLTETVVDIIFKGACFVFFSPPTLLNAECGQLAQSCAPPSTGSLIPLGFSLELTKKVHWEL